MKVTQRTGKAMLPGAKRTRRIWTDPELTEAQYVYLFRSAFKHAINNRPCALFLKRID